ncbi:MAG: septum formation protein Maf [Acidobacteriaceae bacterium]|nr:septum formation protein Maf [Acidobacteriaceae bacterium]MBV9225081.1 septum formation protein Maf [Acidobacteriaceae bacterium]MBV9306053.1 septum formation protein Maf [Acidobacteriaceae bacterium]MBV9939720.1 septum formation protein Maf [Acidobacteriaceae bacterium]
MLILASASPRRHELLLAAGIRHVVQPGNAPELRLSNESPTDFVRRLASEKAQTITPEGEDIILGADTVVCLDGEIFGKPINNTDAARTIRLLSGRTHLVHTGIHLRSCTRSVTDLATTEVEFATLTEGEIERYTRSGEGRDKAGAYAIQGLASRFVRGIHGCYSNVVGLPVSLVYTHLKSFNYL